MENMTPAELKDLRTKDENAYFTFLSQAGRDFPSFQKNELELQASETFPEPYISIAKAIRVFYALIYFEGKEREGTHAKRHLTSFQTLYNGKLADAIFDYLIGAIAGELRHASSISGLRVKFTPKNILTANTLREKAISAATFLDPASLLKTAIAVYSMDGWGGAYGGASWEEISRVTQKISTMSRLRWIDEVIHCRHCGGRLFDRHIVFINEDEHQYKGMKFRQFLDYRRNGSFDFDLGNTTLNDLMTQYSETIDQVLNYKPVAFGFTQLNYTRRSRATKKTTYQNKSTVDKTQKQINEKPFIITPVTLGGLKSALVYVSSKFSVEQRHNFYRMLEMTSLDISDSMAGAKVYILWTYSSCGKQYIRKCTFQANDFYALLKKMQIKLSHIKCNANNASKIKIYFDK